MSTLRSLVTALENRLAAVATARDAANTLLRHDTGTRFEQAPLGRESFHIDVIGGELTDRFGVAGVEQHAVSVRVRLGHPALGTESDRVAWLADDTVAVIREIERLGGDMPGHVLFEGFETDKTDQEWWVTSIRAKALIEETP